MAAIVHSPDAGELASYTREPLVGPGPTLEDWNLLRWAIMQCELQLPLEAAARLAAAGVVRAETVNGQIRWRPTDEAMTRAPYSTS